MGGDSFLSSSEWMIEDNDRMERGGGGGLCSLSSPSNFDSNLDFEQRKMQQVRKQVLRGYQLLQIRCQNLELEDAKTKILSYTPGAWIENSNDEKLLKYEIPEMTTLLLVGPKGSGKSTLVNRISKVFESSKFAPDRAQVSYMASDCDGTYFLQEFTIPRNSASFCLYDTRGLLDRISDNDLMLRFWLKEGVRHGEVVIRNTDDLYLRRRLQQRTCHAHRFHKRRKVNFVIFVVNGVSVLKEMDSEGAGTDQEVQDYNKVVASAFSNTYLSFRDDKPVVVFTHGDLLTLEERVRVRIYLGKLLGIPPATQIFDIPETDDTETDLSITDMLRYALEHADRNLPLKDLTMLSRVNIRAIIFTCAFLIIAMVMMVILLKPVRHGFYKYGASKPDLPINWHEIKYLWSD